MKQISACLLTVALLLCGCGEPATAEAEQPAREEIMIVSEGETAQAEISVPVETAPEAAEEPAEAETVQNATAFFEDASVAAIPATLEELTADMTLTYDADGNEEYADGTRTVKGFEWDIEGARAYLMQTETAAFRYVAEYEPDGKLIRITAVPMSTIDPNVCPDAYATYTELYRYGTAYFGYLHHTEADRVILQTSYGPDNAVLFSCALTLNVYAEAERTAFYDASGTLVCEAIGPEDACDYQDGSGAALTQNEYDELVLSLTGDWLNDYYGSVYGA